MRYWNRNLISATARRPTSTESSGIFDLRSHSLYKNEILWPSIGELTTAGLDLHLDAGDSSSYSGSGTTWFDLTSNNHDFTLINGPVYNSGFGGHFIFDGSNDKAENSSGWTNYGTDPFTVEAWYRNHGSIDFATIVGTQTSGTGTWQMDFINDTIRWQGGGLLSGTGNTRVFNNWVQVVMVREGTGTDQFKIYFNGALDGTHTLSQDFNVSTQLRIAGNRGNNKFFDGDISIIRIYKNKALTAAEVLGNYYYNVYRYV
tara:strand:+ start:557 stop:1333 length:777 start_codon:yes stop_codon:yes gene_type:complete